LGPSLTRFRPLSIAIDLGRRAVESREHGRTFYIAMVGAGVLAVQGAQVLGTRQEGSGASRLVDRPQEI
jgi:hypothetical protein